jgi:hypothetical protein
MIEIWKAIVGYPHYEVSNIGRVRSSKTGKLRILKLTRKQDKDRPCPVYLIASLIDPTGAKKKKRVHRLVLEAFVGPAPSDKPHGCHIDGNSMNNWLANLKWASAVSNEADKELHGTKLFGTAVHNAKLNPAKVRRIRKAHAAGTSTRKLAQSLDVNVVTVRDVINSKTWSWVV